MNSCQIQQIGDGTINVVGEYKDLFEALKQTLFDNGGEVVVDDISVGNLEAKWKHGINPGGLRVISRFNTLPTGQIQITIKGCFKDAIDTFGKAKNKAREIFDSFLQKFPPQENTMIQETPVTPPPINNSFNTSAPQSNGNTAYQGKQKTVAGIFALLLGGLGFHKFYLGSWGWGILYLLFAWTFIPSIIAVIEGISLLCMKDEGFDNKYNFIPSQAFKW